MPQPLSAALDQVLNQVLDADTLVRAVASGRRRNTTALYARAQVRPVTLKAGEHLQVEVTPVGSTTPVTRNYPVGAPAQAAVRELLEHPFTNWHVETIHQVTQLRVTKRGEAQVHVASTSSRVVAPSASAHDRARQHLLSTDDALFGRWGADGDKRRQVEAFLRQLAPVAARLRRDGEVLRLADLGCGNAYLTMAAHRYLRTVCPDGVQVIGIDRRADMVARNQQVADDLGADGLEFRAQPIEEADLSGVDLVLALHACDTATDDALALAVRAGARGILAAPCCHHDVQRQLDERRARASSDPSVVAVPHPYQAITRHPILRERFADVLTDALRADVLRVAGYRVDVVEFVDSRHTPRNALIRAERTQTPATPARRAELIDLMQAWGVRPALLEQLSDVVGELVPVGDGHA